LFMSLKNKLKTILADAPELLESLVVKKEEVWVYALNAQKVAYLGTAFGSIVGRKGEWGDADWRSSLAEGESEVFDLKIRQFLSAQPKRDFIMLLEHYGAGPKPKALLYQAKLYQDSASQEAYLIGVFSHSKEQVDFKAAALDPAWVQSFLFDNLKDAYYALDAEGVFLEISGRRRHEYDFMPYQEVVGKKVTDIFPEDLAQKSLQALKLLAESSKTQTALSYFIDYSDEKGPHRRYFETVIHKLSAHHFLAISSEQTEVLRQKAEMQKRNALQALLLEVSTNFIGMDPNTIAQQVERAMAQLGEALDCRRMFIFEYDFKEELIRSTFNWDTPGGQSTGKAGDTLALRKVEPAQLEAHRRGDSHLIKQLEELSEESIRQKLSQEGIQTILTLPLGKGEQLDGFIGFIWSAQDFKPFAEQVGLLKVFADLLHSLSRQQNLFQRLQLQNQFSSELIERIELPLVVMTDAGRVEQANTAFAELMGLEKGEIIGQMPPYSWWPAYLVEEFSEIYQGFIESESFKQELVFKRANQEEFPAMVIGRGLTSDLGEVHYATFEDLSEHRAVEKNLSRTRNWLMLAQQSAKVAYFNYNFLAQKLEASSHLERILGIDGLQDYDLSNWWELIPDLHRQRYLSLLQKAMEAKEAVQQRLEVFNPSIGLKLWLSIDAAFIFDEGGKVVELQGTVRDISTEIAYVKQIEKQNERLREIAWLQSHELRAPLTRILALVESLDYSNLDVDTKELLQHIGASAIGMDSIITKIIRKSESYGLMKNDQNNRIGDTKGLIAVVDDDPLVCELILAKINRMASGFESSSFANGALFKEYLASQNEAIAEGKVFLVFLDLTMPMVNGWEVLDYIYLQGLDEQVQVYVISNSISTEDKKRAMEYPQVRRYLEKPIKQADLEEAIGSFATFK